MRLVYVHIMLGIYVFMIKVKISKKEIKHSSRPHFIYENFSELQINNDTGCSIPRIQVVQLITSHSNSKKYFG
jgi:hypothetical protein